MAGCLQYPHAAVTEDVTIVIRRINMVLSQRSDGFGVNTEGGRVAARPREFTGGDQERRLVNNAILPV
jgi:hypothetical protein